MVLNNKVYDVLKTLITLILPALGTLYFTVAQIWGLPAAEEVVGTLVAVTTFLGVVVRASTSSYQKNGTDGVLNVVDNGNGGKVFDLSLNGDPLQLADQQVVTFKVNGQG